jgi:membrane protease YdiL (CAAX protease family)
MGITRKSVVLIITVFSIAETVFFDITRYYFPDAYSDFVYWSLITFYGIVTTILYLENKQLKDFFIETPSIILLILFGTVLHRQLALSNELVFQVPIWIFCLAMTVFLITQWKCIPGVNVRDLLWGGIITILVIVILNIFDNLAIGAPIISSERSQFVLIGRSIIYNLSYVAPAEEFVFRGLLWGGLRRLGWSPQKSGMIQGVIFCLLHFQSANLLTLLLIVPSATVLFSYLAYRSKSLFLSILAHAFLNAILPYS